MRCTFLDHGARGRAVCVQCERQESSTWRRVLVSALFTNFPQKDVCVPFSYIYIYFYPFEYPFGGERTWAWVSQKRLCFRYGKSFGRTSYGMACSILCLTSAVCYGWFEHSICCFLGICGPIAGMMLRTSDRNGAKRILLPHSHFAVAHDFWKNFHVAAVTQSQALSNLLPRGRHTAQHCFSVPQKSARSSGILCLFMEPTVRSVVSLYMQHSLRGGTGTFGRLPQSTTL